MCLFKKKEENFYEKLTWEGFYRLLNFPAAVRKIVERKRNGKIIGGRVSGRRGPL